MVVINMCQSLSSFPFLLSVFAEKAKVIYVCMSNLFEYPYQGGVKPVGVCVVFSALDLLVFNSIVFVCLYIFL